MKNIKIFLVPSSDAVECDMSEVRDFFRQLNEMYFDSGINFSILNANEMTEDEMKEHVADSDLSFFLFFEDVSDDMRSCFDIFFKSFKKTDKPKIVTYFKYTESPNDMTEAVREFSQMLGNELKHYYNNYNSIDTLKLGILMQIKVMRLDASQITISDDGMICLNGQPVADTSKIPMFEFNDRLNELKSRYDELTKEWGRLRTLRRRASSSMGKWLMFCSACFVLSLWCLRFATSYYSEIIVESSGLSGPDMFFDSLLRALQTMTMNESCSEFVVLGKEMVSYLYAGRDVSRIAFVYGIYASSLDLLAPISGGLALFSALAAFFPKIRLRISAFKKQYYFSELNERSLALAKSIVNTEGSFFHRPVLVFTDTYTDEDDEKSSELYAAAKKLGAICINDDLVYLDIRSYKGKEIFLMDDVEGDNIKTLSELSYPANAAMLRNALIYIFYQDDSYALIEKKICDSFSGNADAPIITRVKEYENLILDLLEKKPLVGPLVKNYKDGKTAEYTDKNEYNLTIIGSGIIGMQMLLSSSWCGQFYGYKLNINVVSETEKGKFIDSLNGICPEFIASTQKDNPILKIYKDETPEEKAEREPYFRLRYGEYDFNNISTADIECESISDQEEKPFNILESDYFVIALGSDELNMASAEKLERRLSVVQINPDKPEISSKNRVIAFAVYNQSFCNILKNNNNEFNIDVFPFASIEETYSYQNITMANNDSKAKIVDGTYQKNRFSREEVKQKHGIRRYISQLYNGCSD